MPNVTIRDVDVFNSSKDYIKEVRAGLPKLIMKTRTCLRCGRKFMSEHAGCRRCEECSHNMIVMSMCGVPNATLNIKYDR